MRKLKYLWQKLTRGFSDEITWNLNTELAKWLLPRLKRFKELANGYPPNLTPEEWEENLDKVIHALEIEVYEEDVKLWSMFSNDDAKTAYYKKLEKEREEGLKILGEYMGYLWW